MWQLEFCLAGNYLEVTTTDKSSWEGCKNIPDYGQFKFDLLFRIPSLLEPHVTT